jgi:hypothetical protein
MDGGPDGPTEECPDCIPAPRTYAGGAWRDGERCGKCGIRIDDELCDCPSVLRERIRKEVDLREATQEDVGALNGVVARLEKQLEDKTTHTKNTPCIDADEASMHSSISALYDIARRWAEACTVSQTHLQPYTLLGQSTIVAGIPAVVEKLKQLERENADLRERLKLISHLLGDK